MSLLMDALKKAEQTKQQSQEPDDERAKDGGLSLEPLATEVPKEPQEPSRSPLPELSARLEALDEEFMAHIAKPVQTAPAAKPRVEAKPAISKVPAEAAKPQPTASSAETPPPRDLDAIRNVFASKQPVATRNKTFAIIVGAITLVSVAGIGVYFWLQLKPSRGLAPVAPPPVARPATPAAVATAEPPAPAPAVAKPAPQEPAPPVEKPTPASATPQTTAPADAPPPTRAQVPARPSPPSPEDAPIRITRSKLKMNPALSQAFDALNAGDLDTAQTAYEQILKTEPRNLDALHGLAAAAIRQGQLARAEEYYLQAIETDPRDAIAQAGLIGLRGQGDPTTAESRLKTLIASQPDQAFLHFALGNIQAATQRWGDAQQSFFKAYSADPDNPDYLFNLAVSLDHLRQPKLAAQYYNQALVAQNKRPANFDKVQAAIRLRELQP